MPRASLGPRLWFDPGRQNWVIRDGRKFIRTGFAGWQGAQDRFREYMAARPGIRTLPSKAIEGFVYFLTADFVGFPIKIGFTQKLGEMRLKGIQTGCPYRLVMLGMFAGTYQDERELHIKFAAQRLEGEWFAPSDELTTFIKERIGQ